MILVEETELKTLYTRDYRGIHLNLKEIEKMTDIMKSRIPDKKRISFGITYVVIQLGDTIWKSWEEQNRKLFSKSMKSLWEKADNHKQQAVLLRIMGHYGLSTDFFEVTPYIENAAKSDDWILREFAPTFLRMYTKADRKAAQAYLLKLVESDNPYIRRLASESLRPVTDLSWIQKEPDYSLKILRKLFNESAEYPRSSVGNNLSDLARKNPGLVFDLVKELVGMKDKNSYWIAYRACRNLVKTDTLHVLDLLGVDEYKYKKRVYGR